MQRNLTMADVQRQTGLRGLRGNLTMADVRRQTGLAGIGRNITMNDVRRQTGLAGLEDPVSLSLPTLVITGAGIAMSLYGASKGYDYASPNHRFFGTMAGFALGAWISNLLVNTFLV